MPDMIYRNRRFLVILLAIILASIFLACGKLTGGEWVAVVSTAIAAFNITYLKTGAAS